MRNQPLGISFIFFVSTVAVALPLPLQNDGRAAEPEKATLRCGADKHPDKPIVQLSWQAEAEDADGPGTFTLSASIEKATNSTSIAVTSYVPMYNPESNLVRYRVGWASKDFRTSLRLYDRDKVLMGDFESKAFTATDLSCENNLPIRGAKIVFALENWTTVSTALALLDCIKFKRADATIKEEVVTLPVRFVAKADIAKCEARLVALENAKCVHLTRADGTAVPKAENGKTPQNDKPSKTIPPKNPER